MEKNKLIALAGINFYDAHIPEKRADALLAAGESPEWRLTVFDGPERSFGTVINWAEKVCRMILSGHLSISLPAPSAKEIVDTLVARICADTNTPASEWELLDDAPEGFAGMAFHNGARDTAALATMIEPTKFKIRIGPSSILAEAGFGPSEEEESAMSAEVGEIVTSALDACASHGNLLGNDEEVELLHKLVQGAMDFLEPDEAMEVVREVFGKYPPPPPGQAPGQKA